MQDSQHALYKMVTHFLDAHGHAEIAFGAAFAAAATVGVGWVYRDRMPAWLAICTRTFGLLWGVAVLAGPTSRAGQPRVVDHAVMAWLITRRNPTADHVALTISHVLGPPEIAGLTAVVALAVGLTLRSSLCGLTVLVVVGGAASACWLIKQLVGRARPPLSVRETLEWDYSFPSGHVTATAALLGILVVAVGLRGGRGVMAAIMVLAVVAVTAVAFSRVYLGVHWLTDVIAGVVLAAAAVTVGASSLHVLADRAGASPRFTAVADGQRRRLRPKFLHRGRPRTVTADCRIALERTR